MDIFWKWSRSYKYYSESQKYQSSYVSRRYIRSKPCLDLSWWSSGGTTVIIIKFQYLEIARSGVPYLSKVNMSKVTWQSWKSNFPPEPALTSWKVYKLIFFNSGLPNFAYQGCHISVGYKDRILKTIPDFGQKVNLKCPAATELLLLRTLVPFVDLSYS